ncbi:ArsR/SmtB family transcription factor [Amycolatopsis suaedae]|uniref:Transcriptional regulator n=1 Tax=Amycolatopsis suaedae TaxID=2510978 RepID=A0A4Q7J1X7_9PSEU|nr:DUF5937 family protein [Amycolatopsis suaedae]RZQ61421.1 transcriptional regulator [Amycolatopsis suaedae]
MALTVEVGVDDLATTRFAVSPLSETVACLQQLCGRDRNPANLRWLRWARDRLAESPLDLPRTWPLLVGTHRSWPEFLVPAPTGAAPAIDDELATVAGTSARDIRASLARVFGDNPPAALWARPVTEIRAVARELRQAHDRLVAPHWPRIRAALEADIAYRARGLALGGAGQLFAGLHRDLSWQDGRLTLAGDRWRAHRAVGRGPGGLVLLPVALGSAHVLIKKQTSTQTTVRYPARGIATLWTADTGPPADNVVRLLGRPRAEILRALRSPATTTDLARALGVTPSAVSQHLAVLRASDLVARTRAGRNVLYRTTALGTRLLAGMAHAEQVAGSATTSGSVAGLPVNGTVSRTLSAPSRRV